MSLLALAGLGLIFFVAFFTGRKGAAPLPPPSAQRGCAPFVIVVIVIVIASVIMWPMLSSSPLFKGVSTAFQAKPVATHTAQAALANSVVGAPDVSAGILEGVLVQAHSPAQGLGQFIYDEGKQYNIKPSFALAVFHMESDYGTKGVAATLHSLGNIRNGSNGYRSYTSWQESVTDFYQVISAVYIANGLTTVAQIMPVYAPAADGNNPNQYIQVVRTDMTTWSKA